MPGEIDQQRLALAGDISRKAEPAPAPEPEPAPEPAPAPAPSSGPELPLECIHAYLLLSDDWSTESHDLKNVTYKSLRRHAPGCVTVPFEGAREILPGLIMQVASHELREPDALRTDIQRVRSMAVVRRGPFDSLREGTKDPEWGYDIEMIIMSRPTFVVYLSKGTLDVIWRMSHDYPQTPADFGVAMNRLTLLKAEPIRHLSEPAQKTFRALLGECTARLLDDNSTVNVMPLFDKVEMYLRARNNEFSRRTYLTASLLAMLSFAVMAIGVWLGRDWLNGLFAAGFSTTAVSAMMGAIGAFLSVFYRLGDQAMDARAGGALLRIEGCLRILVGVLAAMIVGWAVRSNFVTGTHALFHGGIAAPLLLGALAGASERLVPTLVTKLEQTVGARQPSAPPGELPGATLGGDAVNPSAKLDK